MKLMFGFVDYSKSLKTRKLQLSSHDTMNFADISLQTNSYEKYFYDDGDIAFILNGKLHSLEDRDIASSVKKSFYEGGFSNIIDILDGIFSLVLFDKKKDKLYISRDHLGIYPLYYYVSKDVILFSNDLKQFRKISLFKKEIDPSSVALFFKNANIPAPFTIFKNCFKLPPASYIDLDLKTQKYSIIKYWDLKSYYLRQKSKQSEDEIIKTCEALLCDGIKKGIGDNDKVGVFLSGGYDSSTILALSHKLNLAKNYSYTMGFSDSKHDEAKEAKEISDHLHSKHFEHILTKEDFLGRIEKIASIYPEPFGDRAAFATMILVSDAKKSVSTIFGGEGGDELFYASSFLPKLKFINSIPYPIRYIIAKVIKLHPAIKYQKWGDMLCEKHIEDVLKYKDILISDKDCSLLIKRYKKEHKNYKLDKSDRSKNYLDNIFPAIIDYYVSNNLLTKVGTLALEYDINLQLPFLNKNLIEYLATIGTDIKYKKQVKKYLLKQITYKYIPKSIMDRPKKGFFVPLAEYLKSDFEAIVNKHLSKQKVEKEGILDYDGVQKIIDAFLTEDSYYSEQNMWNLLIFEFWYEYWFDIDAV